MNRKQIDDYVATIPKLSQGLIGRAISGEAKSPRQAIKAKCLDCCGYSREEASNCSVWTCPLFHLNPYRSSSADAESASAEDSRAIG